VVLPPTPLQNVPLSACSSVIQPPCRWKTFCFVCFYQPALRRKCVFVLWTRGGSRGGAIGANAPLKPTIVALFTRVLYNSQNTIRNLKAILSSIVLSQQCFEVYLISLTAEKPLWDFNTKYYWNRPPLGVMTLWPLVTCMMMHRPPLGVCKTRKQNLCRFQSSGWSEIAWTWNFPILFAGLRLSVML